MMKVLIADDEPLARDRLRNLLAREDDVEIVAEAADGREAVEQATATRPDIVLLDIRMPGMDGLEAARHIAALPDPPAVIFTTAFGEHALEAFEAAACDYLVKPVKAERLQRALANAQRLTRPQASRLQPGAKARREHLSVRTRTGLQLVPVAAIRYFKADHKYTLVRTAEEEFLIEESLKSLEEEFAEDFLRIHRNALINLRHLAALERRENGRHLVRLQGVEETLDVSRAHLPGLRARLENGGNGKAMPAPDEPAPPPAAAG